MLSPGRRRVLQRVALHRPEILAAATRHNLDPWTITGVVAQESAGNTFAVRVERGFWRRYGAAVIANAIATVSPRDDHWVRYPELASVSYGLMQVMYPVAIERGMLLEYPTELCDPAVGLDAGCRQLSWLLRRTPDERTALQRYNGGGDPRYYERVWEWVKDARTGGGV